MHDHICKHVHAVLDHTSILQIHRPPWPPVFLSLQFWHPPGGNIYFLANHPSTYMLKPKSQASAHGLERLYNSATASSPKATGTTSLAKNNNSDGGGNSDHFDQKTDKASADLYFHYYGMLQHQQNMLQDYIRTGTYYSAITENTSDFIGKAVMDVGCGSGILSLFAAKAGARVVYAVEASNMARFARQLAETNPEIGSKIKVIHGKVEEIDLPEKVDVLVSEPMGTLLVNERMLESYIYARDTFLKPGGKLFPRVGRIHVAAFSDSILYSEIATKAQFWQQPSFYGVDLTCLHTPAAAGYFNQVVVDQIPPNVLVSNTAAKTFDFSTCTETELQDFTIPLSLQVAAPCTVHGIASWFDVLFDGSTVQRYLSTSPGLPVTHWFQLRCVLETPITVYKPGDTVSGELRLVAHSRQSYDVHVTLRAAGPEGAGAHMQESKGIFDLKEPYYRQLVSGGNWYNEGMETGGYNGNVGNGLV
jgi:type I protein arginine methyltransferase